MRRYLVFIFLAFNSATFGQIIFELPECPNPVYHNEIDWISVPDSVCINLYEDGVLIDTDCFPNCLCDGAPQPSESDLSIVKTVDNAAPIEGDNVVYTLVVTNNGPDDDTNLTITDNLPVGVMYVSDDQGNAFNDGVENIGNLAVGATYTVNITASTNNGSANNLITNTGSVAGDNQGNNLINNSDSVDITPTINSGVCPDVVVSELYCGPANGLVNGGSKQCGSFECFYYNTITGDYYPLSSDVSDCNNLPIPQDFSNYYIYQTELNGCAADTQCAMGISSDISWGGGLPAPQGYFFYQRSTGNIVGSYPQNSLFGAMTAFGNTAVEAIDQPDIGIDTWVMTYDCSQGDIGVIAYETPSSGIHSFGGRPVASSFDNYPHLTQLTLPVTIPSGDLVRFAQPFALCTVYDPGSNTYCADFPTSPDVIINQIGGTATITQQGTGSQMLVSGNSGDDFIVTVPSVDCPTQTATVTGQIQ